MVDDVLDVKVFDENKKLVEGEIKMTFGLLNALVKIVGDVNRIGIIDIYPEMADEVLAEVLTPRTSTGKKADPTFALPDLPASEAEKIFDWVKESLFDFFLRRLQNTAALMAQKKTSMDQIASSFPSSKG